MGNQGAVLNNSTEARENSPWSGMGLTKGTTFRRVDGYVQHLEICNDSRPRQLPDGLFHRIRHVLHTITIGSLLNDHGLNLGWLRGTSCLGGH